MNCTKCDMYSYPLRRCLKGYANPRTLKTTLTAISIMGLSYICPYNKWKRKIVKEATEKITGKEAQVG